MSLALEISWCCSHPIWLHLKGFKMNFGTKSNRNEDNCMHCCFSAVDMGLWVGYPGKSWQTSGNDNQTLTHNYNDIYTSANIYKYWFTMLWILSNQLHMVNSFKTISWTKCNKCWLCFRLIQTYCRSGWLIFLFTHTMNSFQFIFTFRCVWTGTTTLALNSKTLMWNPKKPLCEWMAEGQCQHNT